MIVKRLATVEEAFDCLRSAFLKRRNVLVVREKLHNARQFQGEDLNSYYRRCVTLSQDCEFESVSSEENVRQNARDAFAVGIRNSHVKARSYGEGGAIFGGIP